MRQPSTTAHPYELYASIVSLTSEAIGVIGLDGRYVEQNETHRKLLGYSDAELTGQTPALHLGEEMFGRIASELAEHGAWRGECVSQARDGRKLLIELSAFTVRDEAGQPVAFVGIKRDITLRRKTEAALRESETRFRTAFDNAPIGLALVGPDGRFLKTNPSFSRITGYPADALRQLNFQSITHPEDLETDLALMRGVLAGDVDTMRMEKRYIHRDGHVVWVRLSASLVRSDDGRPVHFVSQIEDVTEARRVEVMLRQTQEDLERRVQSRTAELRSVNAELRGEIAERQRIERALRESQEQLVRSQKMEAVGHLSGSIAHEFNNLLTVILGYAHLGGAGDRGPAVTESLRGIREAAERAATLTRQLLAFSRHQVLAPRSIDLNALVLREGELLRPLMGELIEMRFDMCDEAPRVHVDPVQIEQVVLNLVNNARDAMPGGGVLTLRTRVVTMHESLARAEGLGARTCAALEVRDTGSGMPPEVLAHAFEPFFTTKAEGHGTGLGLSTAYGIVRQHGGAIRADSATGEGSTFTVYLPISPSGARPPEPSAIAPGEGGSETILLAEDAAPLRIMAAQSLRVAGYHVLEAADGVDAVRVAAAHQGAIDLLLTDVVMPHMRGTELAAALAGERPGCRVLYMSGYAKDGIAEGASFIAKPFTPTELRAQVRSVLDAAIA